MEWLVAIGVVCLLAGALFLSSGGMLHKVGDVLNRPIVFVDSKINSIRIPVGIVLVIIGGWIMSVGFSYPVLWYLHIIGVLALFFGLLYLFLPQWVMVISKVSDQLLFSTDELILGARKSLGVVLLIIAVYSFYAAYLTAK
ncbi:hypothetical protein HZB08_02465 [Candidatus Saganbacteria bacterium]|uniref:Uncharacterized protein n=1 Tax=Candidatus Saganbacteria bacterium TaxID=2575572 RepID=A0A9D6UK57_UNCSA|nr:hypothetical protein [Candidatus Saganbacteria bacterium]